MLFNRLKLFKQELSRQGLYRQLNHGDQEGLINFSSNDYLSLSVDKAVQRAYQTGFKYYPVGSGGSRLINGHRMHRYAERAFAEALGVDDCILFSSGYAANLALTALLAALNAEVIVDKAVHASIYDGLALRKILPIRYRHNDLGQLRSQLRKAGEHSAIITESIFSMSGQITPLKKIVSLSNHYKSTLFVDEAHAFGLCGKQGLGRIIDCDLTQEDVPIRVIPLGKAFGACGAILAGKKVWLDALLQVARPLIYSTAISPAMAYGYMLNLEVVRAADNRREKLHELIVYFRQAIGPSSLSWRDSSSAIQYLRLGCSRLALAYANHLYERGIYCQAIRCPTVSQSDTGLRITLNYNHQTENIDYLFSCLDKIRHNV
ncbi:MAG: aminotransferase class I/II-fold pyridoxal phosphate-dependent enzyme [Legionella sp.]